MVAVYQVLRAVSNSLKNVQKLWTDKIKIKTISNHWVTQDKVSPMIISTKL